MAYYQLRTQSKGKSAWFPWFSIRDKTSSVCTDVIYIFCNSLHSYSLVLFFEVLLLVVRQQVVIVSFIEL